MQILKTLGKEEINSEDKLVFIEAMVKSVREKYENTDVEIEEIKVHTADGYVPLSLLNDAEKVAVATQAIKNAVATATVTVENVQGTKFDRVFEAMIAVDAILCNLDAKTDSSY